MKFWFSGLFTGLLFLLQLPVTGQLEESLIPFDEAYKRMYVTTRLVSHIPEIDGKLDDECWLKDGAWSLNFIQNTPVERGKPSFETRIKILFDDRNLYFALRAWDPEPSKINRFVGNRDDNSTGDLISVAFDTYHDFRAAAEFNINAGGNKTDLIVTDNLSVNLNWNAVWEGKTWINDSSWTAEFRIPLNQLRYSHSDTGMVWGLHVRRIIRRIQETDQWSLIPRKNSGHVYSFGTMVGLKSVKKPRLIEFLPYVSGKATFEPEIKGHPYKKGQKWTGNAGIDGKFGLGDLTLDVTINPDFGQIEADPSVMNLTSFETFYEEKRPFFLEGKHIFDFTADQNMMFYSRRIGHAPSWSPIVDNQTSFSDIPEFTSIINAVKLSGTTKKGLSIGILQSTTQEETGHYSESGIETKPVAEPLTNYLVGRVQKISANGNTQVGTMFTSVNRNITEPQLDYLNKNAFAGGIDFLKYSKNRDYFIDFKGMVSHVAGKEEAMLTVQKNSLHYFQRPDASHYLGIDTSRRSLTGTGGYLSFGRQGNNRLVFSEKISWWSPRFDLNDAGYLYMADLNLNQTKASYRQTEPKGMLRNYTLSLSQMNGWNYGGEFTYHDVTGEFSTMFKNRWELVWSETYVFADLATRLLRGGPSFRLSPYLESDLAFNTDESKRMIYRFESSSSVSSDKTTRYYILEPSLSFRLGNHFFITGDFEYKNSRDKNMYVTQLPYQGSLSYIVATIKQNTYNFTFRINYNISPDISIQYYGSPFISNGKYDHFKRVNDADSKKESQRTAEISSITYNPLFNTYDILEAGNPLSFDNPDFTFREFRSNLVARWEYRPGSTLYLVWEHHRNTNDSEYQTGFGRNFDRLFSEEPVNVFMVKMNFWLGI